MILDQLPNRFKSKIRISDTGCWIWTASENSKGYGQYYFGSRLVRAHRFAYEFLVGPVPDGLELDHLCLVKGCVNPAHLEPVTHEENVRRAVAAGLIISRPNANKGKKMQAWRRSHCKRGHDLSLHGREVPGDGRKCRICHRDLARAQYQGKRLAEAANA